MNIQNLFWYHYFALAGLLVCLITFIFHFLKLVRLGFPEDFSNKLGDPKVSIVYSFTGALNPVKKESAYLHLPTYIAGLIYHFGTFLAAFIFFSTLFGDFYNEFIKRAFIIFLCLSALCGIGILIKRISLKKIRSFSTIDDYVSNVLVTLFQITSALLLFSDKFSPLYFICTGILLIYMPAGKLKHAFYFFAARYQLGLFYGWRGVWPIRRSS